MSSGLSEQVLVFPTKLLHDIGYFRGLTTNVNAYLPRILDPNVFSFKPRSEAETDPDFKQVIPYVILRFGSEVFTYARGQFLREKRLLHNYSIGLGGHISYEDTTPLFSPEPIQFYTAAVMREVVGEEVYIDTVYEDRRVAVINDDSDEVGRVHIGIVHVFDLQAPLVRKKEKSITDVGFRTIEKLVKRIDQFESWSKICIRALERGEFGR